MAASEVGALRLRVSADTTGVRTALDNASRAVKGYARMVDSSRKPSEIMDAHFRVLPRRIANNVKLLGANTRALAESTSAMVVVKSAGTAMKAGMLAAARGVKALWIALGSMRKYLIGASIAIIALITIVKLLGSAKESMAETNELADMADQLGMAAGKLKELHIVSQLSGGSAKLLNASLETMSKRVGEAARGGGAASMALRELGIDAKKLTELKTDEQFEAIAHSFVDVQGGSKKAAIAANIFSKANMRVAETLEAVVNGSVDAKSILKKTGGAITEKDVARARSYADSVEMMEIATKGFKNQAAKLVGTIGTAVVKFGTFVVKVFTGIFGAIQSIFKQAAKVIGYVVNALSGGGFSWSEWSKNFEQAYDSVSLGKRSVKLSEGDEEANKRILSIQMNINKVRLGSLESAKYELQVMGASVKKIAEFEARYKELADLKRAAAFDTEIKKLNQEILKATLSAEDFRRAMWKDQGYASSQIDALAAVKTKLDEINVAKKVALDLEKKVLEQQKKALTKEKKKMAAGKATFEGTLTQLEKLKLRQQEIKDQFRDGVISKDTRDRALGANKKEMSGLDALAESKSQGASGASHANLKGSASAYNAIVNSLGKNDHQKSIAENTKGMRTTMGEEARDVSEIRKHLTSYDKKTNAIDAKISDL